MQIKNINKVFFLDDMPISNFRIKDFPAEERPRERIIKFGPKSLSTSELLAIILRTGNKKENVLQLSKRLLSSHNIKNLSRIRFSSLNRISGIGKAKACQLMACFELGRRISCMKQDFHKKADSAKDIARLMIPELQGIKKEHFIGIFLDTRMKMIKKETIFMGTLDSSLVHPRELFKIALDEYASSVILVHNHPSGNPSPSDDDIDITRQFRSAGDMIGVTVLDHIIIGDKKYFSFKEEGII